MDGVGVPNHQAKQAAKPVPLADNATLRVPRLHRVEVRPPDGAVVGADQKTLFDAHLRVREAPVVLKMPPNR